MKARLTMWIPILTAIIDRIMAFRYPECMPWNIFFLISGIAWMFLLFIVSIREVFILKSKMSDQKIDKYSMMKLILLIIAGIFIAAIPIRETFHMEMEEWRLVSEIELMAAGMIIPWHMQRAKELKENNKESEK